MLHACKPLHAPFTPPASAPAGGSRRRGLLRGQMGRPTLVTPRAAFAEVAESLHLLRFPEGASEVRPTDRRGLCCAADRRCARLWRSAAAPAHCHQLPSVRLQEDVAAVVDGIWSLQYMAAGPICGSAGPLAQFQCGGGEGAAPACQPFTHAVLFRYSNAATRERFEAQPRVQLMLGGTGAPAGTGGCGAWGVQGAGLHLPCPASACNRLAPAAPTHACHHPAPTRPPRHLHNQLCGAGAQ